MSVFVVGKTYEAANRDFCNVTVVSRTPKMAKVSNGSCTWRTRIRVDDKGNEYIVDNTVPKRYRDELTWKACWEVSA